MPFSSWNASYGIISVYRTIEDPTQRANADRASIPIERASARIMLVCGEAETMWPACPMSRVLVERSAERSGPSISVLAYQDAGHFIFGSALTPGAAFYDRLDMFGGSVKGNATARRQLAESGINPEC